MKSLLVSLAAPFALVMAPAPVLAQEEMPDDAMAALRDAFPVEPLTAEQQARLPLATQVVEKILPEGAMGEIMGSMFDGVLGPIMEMARPSAGSIVADRLGLIESDLGLDEEAAKAAATMLDPAWQERAQRQADVMPVMMNRMMTAMEPSMRRAMSEIYAVYFDEEQLVDIDAFFSTPSGAAYARQSYAMAADPRLIGAMMNDMPVMFGALADMETLMAEAVADLPAERGFTDLSASERKRLADMTGLTVEELEEQMEWVASQAASGGF